MPSIVGDIKWSGLATPIYESKMEVDNDGVDWEELIEEVEDEKVDLPPLWSPPTSGAS